MEKELINILKYLTLLAKSSNELLEGNVYTEHNTFNVLCELNNNRLNLKKFSNNCSNILEIGFNAGHSAAILLYSNKDLFLTSIDINMHKYTNICQEKIKSIFKNRFNFVEGDSKYIKKLILHEKKYDGLIIDGCHINKYYIYDLINSLEYLKNNSQIIIDDVNLNDIKLFSVYLQDKVLFNKNDNYLPTSFYKHIIYDYKIPNTLIMLNNNEQKIIKWIKKHNYKYVCKKDIYNLDCEYIIFIKNNEVCFNENITLEILYILFNKEINISPSIIIYKKKYMHLINNLNKIESNIDKKLLDIIFNVKDENIIDTLVNYIYKKCNIL